MHPHCTQEWISHSIDTFVLKSLCDSWLLIPGVPSPRTSHVADRSSHSWLEHVREWHLSWAYAVYTAVRRHNQLAERIYVCTVDIGLKWELFWGSSIEYSPTISSIPQYWDISFQTQLGVCSRHRGRDGCDGDINKDWFPHLSILYPISGHPGTPIWTEPSCVNSRHELSWHDRRVSAQAVSIRATAEIAAK